MSVAVLAVLLTVGAGVGFLAGLVGIGGGVLMVPLLYLYYGVPGFAAADVDPMLHAALAHATSLFVIVPTAVRGTLAYHRARLIEWRAVLPIALGSIVAAVAGARVALLLPAAMLKLGFGLFVVASGVNLLRRAPAAVGSTGRSGWPVLVATGLLAGFMSALLGVGGGLVAIPLLIYFTRLPIERVAATSLAVVVCAASSGVVTYIASGLSHAGLPPTSVGYVDLAAGIPLMLGALVAVEAGTRLNRRLRSDRLRQVFAVLLTGLGLQLVVVQIAALI